MNVIFPKNTLFSKCSEIKSLFEDTHGGGRVIVYNPYAKIVELMFYIPDVEFYGHVLSNLSLPGKFEVCKCAYTEKDEAQLSFIVAQLNGWISGLYEYMNSSFMSNQIAKHERKYQDRTKQIIKQLGGAKKSMHYRMESMSFLCAKFPNSIDGLVDGVAKASQCIAKVISDLKNKFQANLGEKTARQFFYAWNLGFEFVHGYENKLVQLSWDIYFLDDINQENSTLKSKNKEIDGLSLAGESANLSVFMQTVVGPSIQRWTDDFKKLGLPFSYVKNRIPTQNMDILPSLEQLLPLLVGDSIHTVRTVNPVVNKLKFFSCGRL